METHNAVILGYHMAYKEEHDFRRPRWHPSETLLGTCTLRVRSEREDVAVRLGWWFGVHMFILCLGFRVYHSFIQELGKRA